MFKIKRLRSTKKKSLKKRFIAYERQSARRTERRRRRTEAVMYAFLQLPFRSLLEIPLKHLLGERRLGGERGINLLMNIIAGKNWR